ncbi:hypothetical protein PR202_ga25684 [Eleusine coracana subsp. coracana]|uniref:C2 domain-containing protein n=1 Tax=Eleusine coracana subsp. coracana TaxID=191504 RepID=A0AAV5DBZ1_ELECO|nr:hypothetical protein PR202_ga25684 [Eleusine coracana subsp. coracana]
MVGEGAWRRVVVVEVCNALNLMPKDGQGTVSAYAVVDFARQRRRTATCPRDLNPQWEERLEFRLLDTDILELETLELNLYHEKKGSGRPKFLGKVKIPGTWFAKEGEEVLSYFPLQKRSVFSSQIKGEIGLKIWFFDGPLPPPVPAALTAEDKRAAASDAAAAKAEEKPNHRPYVRSYFPQDDFDESIVIEDMFRRRTSPWEVLQEFDDVVSLAASSLDEPTLSTATSHGTSQDQAKETVSQENNPEPSPLTPPLKGPAWQELSSCSEARLLQHSLQMDTYNALERMLVDESEELRPLPLSLLETITNNFSEDMKIGSGGFAVVYKVGEDSAAPITIGLIAGILEIHIHADKASYYCREHLGVR